MGIFPNFRGENKQIFETTTQDIAIFLFWQLELAACEIDLIDWGSATYCRCTKGGS